MKRIIALLALTCALSVSSVAGEIPTCSTVTPDVSTVGTTDPVAGGMPADSSTEPSEAEPSILTTVVITFISYLGR
jgi:hypothetical protein